MCPPRDDYFSPFGQYRWMMALGFSNFSDPVSEFYGFDEILESKLTFEPFDTFTFNDLPAGNLLAEFSNFRVTNCRFASAAWHTFHLR
jgi:hypothetical protein